MKKNKAAVVFQLLGGMITGGLFFLLAVYLLYLPLFIAIPAAIAGFVGGRLLFAAGDKKRRKINSAVFKRQKVRKEDLARYLNESYGKVNKIKELAAVIDSRNLKSSVEEICRETEAVLENVRKDPDDIYAARRFLDYIFHTTIQILEQFRIISSDKKQSKEVRELVKKAEEMMKQINTSVREQHNKLLENNIMDLDAELKVLENVLKMDGFM